MSITLQPGETLLAQLHSSVDQVSWKCFNAAFEMQYRKARGDEFQRLFRGIMRKAHGEEFAEVRPHGSLGDCSCDGYLRTTKTVFACYAPKSTRERRARVIAKIRSDHAGAVEHWKVFMSAWKVVHNDDEGLPPDVVQVLLELRGVDAEVDVGDWNIEDIRPTVQQLRRDDLVDLFGPQPSLRDLVGLSHADIKVVVDELAVLIEHAVPATAAADVRQVPPTKMVFNRLSRAAREFLQLGEQKFLAVQSYFERHTDPLLSGRIANRFGDKYIELRDQQLHPDEIFHELQIFAGYYRQPNHQMGALALLAYLFETCHIFERPPDDEEVVISAAANEDALPGPIADRSGGGDPPAPV